VNQAFELAWIWHPLWLTAPFNFAHTRGPKPFRTSRFSCEASTVVGACCRKTIEGFFLRNYLSQETIVSGFKKANMIEALPSADHVEQSVDIPDSVTDALVGALAHTVLEND